MKVLKIARAIDVQFETFENITSEPVNPRKQQFTLTRRSL